MISHRKIGHSNAILRSRKGQLIDINEGVIAHIKDLHFVVMILFEKVKHRIERVPVYAPDTRGWEAHGNHSFGYVCEIKVEIRVSEPQSILGYQLMNASSLS